MKNKKVSLEIWLKWEQPALKAHKALSLKHSAAEEKNNK
jgi:hypothetical protein